LVVYTAERLADELSQRAKEVGVAPGLVVLLSNDSSLRNIPTTTDFDRIDLAELKKHRVVLTGLLKVLSTLLKKRLSYFLLIGQLW
jgi:hypothetical protein